MPAVIGNSDRLGVELVPVFPYWEQRYSPEAAAWAGLAIWANGRNLCSHVEVGSSDVQQYLFVPLGAIADWIVRSFPALAFEERARDFPTGRALHQDVHRWGHAPPPVGIDEDDWLEAREAWWSRHFLHAGAEGARLPNLALVRDDERLVITWEAPHFAQPRSPVMVWRQGYAEIPWTEAAGALGEFVITVRNAFVARGVNDAYRWLSSDDPLGDGLGKLRYAIELYAGRNIESVQRLIGADDFEAVLQMLHLAPNATDPAASPVCQVLRDLSSQLSPDVGQVLREVGNRATSSAPERTGEWLRGRDLAFDAGRAGETPEEAGQFAAVELRRALDVDGRPVADVPEVLRRVGIDVAASSVDGGPDRMMVSGTSRGSPIAMTLRTPRTDTTWGLRFEQARALGHLLLDPLREGAVGAGSGPFAGSARRRRSGAFAAEFLLPGSALERASGGRLDGVVKGNAFDRLMTEYGVGARTAAFQLWNRDWLSSISIRDELMDRRSG